MIKHIVLDIGGVMVYPRLGEWNLPYGEAAILGEKARDIATSKYLIAHRNALHWLDESQRIDTVEEERALRRGYFRDMNAQMGWNLPDVDIWRLGDDFTDNINRYGFFNDVLPWLNRWRDNYTVSVLSDAMPSITVFLNQWGVLPYLTAQVYSFQQGVIKPDRAMYDAVLKALGAKAEECLYADDKLENVLAAQALGFHAVQMARSETLPPQLWNGPVARSFEALNARLDAMNKEG